jgi:hypothetical protein
MQGLFLSLAKRILSEGVAAAAAHGVKGRDYRAALCRWEDDLFEEFPAGHRILTTEAASGLIASLFEACGRTPPDLRLVAGFDDPRIGGFADVARHSIVIEHGCLYRFLVLHESAHLLVPADRHHGAVFIYVLQSLYRSFIGIPEATIRDSLRRHGLPAYTAFPDEICTSIAA